MSAHPVFTPAALSAQERDELTVGRTRLFETLVDRIRSAARDGSRPHTLLIAPRGGGKTHTLHVSVNRALAHNATADNVLSAVIPEDSLAIGAYIDLLVEIARAIDPGLAEVARGLRREKDPIGIEAAIMAAAGDRMILLAIENLDRVFDSLGAAGQGSLRAWVETSAAILVLATSPALFSGVSSRSYPWYGSFIVETLPELTVHDGAQLLIRAAHRRNDFELAALIDSAQGRERLTAIHRLAGGSPRLWHILSDCIDVDSLDALVPAVETLLDRLAPYYQQQLWQLPAGEQRLVVELARGWQPRTVSDLAAAVGVSNQSAATALGRLTETRWVTSSKSRSGDRRASWYDLTEPLLRYHLQFRDDRGKPLRLIVEFLRAFYSRDRSLAELNRTSEPAVAVRLTLASSLLDDGEPDAAVVTLNALIDDLADRDDIDDEERDIALAWTYWARAVSLAANATERHVPDAKDAGTGIALAVMQGDVAWTDLPKIMSALPKKDTSEVAVHIVFTARVAGIELPPENGPLGYLDAGDRDFIDFALTVVDSP